tara:strand:- start:4576 stop:4851 length:276 start_codon:yes stop_codon:yes gene_type:complete
MSCIEECRAANKACKNKDCRLWIDYKEDLNCTHEAVKKSSSISLREAAKRLGISFVRVKQIEDKALGKLLKGLQRETSLSKEHLKELLICE